MTRFAPVRSPVLDSLLAYRRPVESVDPPPPGSLSLLRLALVGAPAIGVAVLFRFPPWAVLVLPAAALASLAVRRWRWPFRAACSAALAAYTAQLIQLALFTWAFRFGAAFALFMAAAFCWGLRMDEFD